MPIALWTGGKRVSATQIVAHQFNKVFDGVELREIVPEIAR
jgi:hypothetical protein